jgi:hypothetical protein
MDQAQSLPVTAKSELPRPKEYSFEGEEKQMATVLYKQAAILPDQHLKK